MPSVPRLVRLETRWDCSQGSACPCRAVQAPRWRFGVQCGAETPSGSAPSPLRPSCLPKGRATGEDEPPLLLARTPPASPVRPLPSPAYLSPAPPTKRSGRSVRETRHSGAGTRVRRARNDITSADMTRSLPWQWWDARVAWALEHLSY